MNILFALNRNLIDFRWYSAVAIIVVCVHIDEACIVQKNYIHECILTLTFTFTFTFTYDCALTVSFI